MLRSLSQDRVDGFSMVELLFVIMVMGVLVSLAMPSFRTWLQNIQIRTAAQSITSGLQRARAEAVTRNTLVAFTFGTNTAWTINVVNPASVIESRPSSDGSEDVTRTTLPAGATTLTFGNLGVAATTNADGSAPLTQVDLTTANGTRNMRVVIGVGGNARMCDPSLPAGSSPSAC